jgi:hypothetical protein
MAQSDPLLSEVDGKKIARENRRVPEGTLRILRSGGRWQDLPGKHLLPRRAGGVPGLEEQGV